MVMCFTYYSCFVTLFTGFIKHIFYGDRLFGGLKIYSSQLVLISTAFYYFALKWPMCADVPLNHIKIKSNLSVPPQGAVRYF